MVENILQKPKEKSFCMRYCEQRGCSPGQFEERVLKECFYAHALPLVHWLWERHRAYLAPDLELIRVLAPTCSLGEFTHELENHRFYQPPAGFWRRRLRVRVSGRLLLALAEQLFGPEKKAPQTSSGPASSPAT